MKTILYIFVILLSISFLSCKQLIHSLVPAWEKADMEEEDEAARRDHEALMKAIEKDRERQEGQSPFDEDTGGCFTADTLVLTDNGAKRIADVAVGDVLLTSNSQGKIKTSQVSKALRFKNDHYFIINEQIKVTKMHRFFTEAGWKRVRDLKIGDMVQKSDGTFEAIRSKELVRAKLTVYNLEIKDDHNFYVSSNGKSGYLVHNNGGNGK